MNQQEPGELPASARVVLLPAAGISRRMGEHKLSLPLGESTLIGRTIDNYLAADLDLVIVVRRPDDDKLRDVLPCSDRVLLVTPEQPPEDMKASLNYALSAVRRLSDSTAEMLYLLSPPDMPLLRAELVNQLLNAWKSGDEVLVPTCAGRRGHPVLFSDRIARLAGEIAPDLGLNSLWSRRDVVVRETGLEDDVILFDVDTPEDYAEARQRVAK